ncbi:GTP-binding protein Rho1 [Serendipita sp. 396]|nr:GTP-binding protein Rho1 [Serendipita sp. 396]
MLSRRSRPLRRKLVVIGDPGVGKTSLIQKLYFGDVEYSNPGCYEVIIKDVEVDGKEIELALWDTAGKEDYDRLRPLSYPGTDVLLLCFTVDKKSSFESIETKWFPEFLFYRPNATVPYLLVGCRSDMRRFQTTTGTSRQTGSGFVTLEMAEAMAQKIGAEMYLECSMLTGDGMKQLLESASRASLLSQKPRRRLGCIAF